jgi:hypothetical protein
MILKLSILLPLLLNSIVGEMNEFIVYIFETELFTGCSDIALLIPVPLDYAVDSCNQNVATYVEFASIVQKRILHIFLNYKAVTLLAFLVRQQFNLVQITKHANTIAPIRILSWLAYPYIGRSPLLLCPTYLLEMLGELYKLGIR